MKCVMCNKNSSGYEVEDGKVFVCCECRMKAFQEGISLPVNSTLA